MTISVTEKAVRDLVRNLLEQDLLTQPDVPSPDEGDAMATMPIQADPTTEHEDLGPPVQDENYAPEDHDQLQAAAEKLLKDVPENLIPAVFKHLRKLVDKAIRTVKKESESDPNKIVSERINLLPLIELISEQMLPYTVDLDSAKNAGYEDPDFEKIKLSGEEEEDEFDDTALAPKKKAPQPAGRRIYAVVPPKSSKGYVSSDVPSQEEEPSPEPPPSMIDDVPRTSSGERELQKRAQKEKEKKDIEQSKVAKEMAEKAASEKLQIAKKIYNDDKDLMKKLEGIDDPIMLDSVLTPDQVFEVEEEFMKTDTAQEIADGGARSFSDMSEAQRGKFSEILLGMEKSISKSAFRNIRDAGFMKFLAGLAMGPDKFKDESLAIIQDVPKDAKPIHKFLLKSIPWSKEFKSEVKKSGKFPPIDLEGANDILTYLNQQEEDSKEGGTLLDDYTSLVHYYLAVRDNFPGAVSSMRKFHFNKDTGKEALEVAVKGMSERGDKKSYDELVRILNDKENQKEVQKQLGKDYKIPEFIKGER